MAKTQSKHRFKDIKNNIKSLSIDAEGVENLTENRYLWREMVNDCW